MKSDKKILIAFILNLFFSIFEFVGGTITNSVAIVSDSLHDFGDALSIGISYLLEKKSKRKPDNYYTYGYIRYSIIGSLITTSILIIASIFVIYNAVLRLFNPVKINYTGMIVFALIGIVTNVLAAYFTKDGHSLNQKSVNLHMFEDLLGWIVILIGAIIMNFTNISIIDPILSIFVSLFIFIHAIKNLKKVIDLFLIKIPNDISIEKIKESLIKLSGVEDIHHIHIWSLDGYNKYATMHIVTNENNNKIKETVKDKLKEYGISHATIELENPNENCHDEICKPNIENSHKHHH